MNKSKLITALTTVFALLILIIGLPSSCTQINTGEVGIKLWQGNVVGKPLSPGWYFYVPLVSNIQILNTRVQTVEQDSQAASHDLQNVQTALTLNYHLGALDPISHYTRLGNDQVRIETTIVKPAMSEAFKAVVAQYNAEELITKRDIVSNQIVSTLAGKLKQYDLYVDSVSVTNFKFSEAYANAIEAKQVAEQDAGKEQNKLRSIQIQAQQQIVEANAKAQAMKAQQNAITPELLQLKWIEKWNGQLPGTMLGSSNNVLYGVNSK